MKPASGKTRIISFRLPKEYVEIMKKVCAEQGLDKISDYARLSVLRALEERHPSVPMTETNRTLRLLEAIDEARKELRRLTALVEKRGLSPSDSLAKGKGAGS